MDDRETDLEQTISRLALELANLRRSLKRERELRVAATKALQLEKSRHRKTVLDLDWSEEQVRVYRRLIERLRDQN